MRLLNLFCFLRNDNIIYSINSNLSNCIYRHPLGCRLFMFRVAVRTIRRDSSQSWSRCFLHFDNGFPESWDWAWCGPGGSRALRGSRSLVRPHHRDMHLHGLGRFRQSRCPGGTIRAERMPLGHHTPWGYRWWGRFPTDQRTGLLLGKRELL